MLEGFLTHLSENGLYHAYFYKVMFEKDIHDFLYLKPINKKDRPVKRSFKDL